MTVFNYEPLFFLDFFNNLLLGNFSYKCKNKIELLLYFSSLNYMLSKVTRFLINGNEKMRKKAKLDKKIN